MFITHVHIHNSSSHEDFPLIRNSYKPNLFHGVADIHLGFAAHLQIITKVPLLIVKFD